MRLFEYLFAQAFVCVNDNYINVIFITIFVYTCVSVHLIDYQLNF